MISMVADTHRLNFEHFISMRSLVIRALTCLALGLISVQGLLAQDAPAASELTAGIGKIVEEAFSADLPGATVIAVCGGETVFRGARGLANIELRVPLEPSAVLRLGSLTKQFTAAAIMMLVDENELSLDDEITKFLPDYPTQGNKITVEHLLTHTSGIKSYTNIRGWMQTRILERMTVDELIDGFKDEPMEFQPGEKFKYNNSGYVLLGAIIEKVSGMSYADFVQKRIFDPLNMMSSYYGNHARIIPNRASGYGGSTEHPLNAPYLSMTQPYAAGSLLSTVDDLARWNQALFAGEVVSPQSLEKMITAHELADGTSTGYGYGLVPTEIRGRRAIVHGGGIFGFSTYGIYLPDDQIYVAVLCNSTSPAIPPGRVASEIAALAAGDPFPTFAPITVSPDILRSYVGVYRIDENSTRTVTVSNGKLFTQHSGSRRLEATPHTQTAFFYPSSLSHFEFVINEAGEVTGMNMYANGSKQPAWSEKTTEQPGERKVAEVDPDIYDDYQGTYQLASGFEIKVWRDGERLMTQATGQQAFELFPESEIVFFLKVVDAQLTFVRGEDGQVNQVILKQAGREAAGKRIK